MRVFGKAMLRAGLAVASFGLTATSANASVVINIAQSGANVVATMSGTINIQLNTQDGSSGLGGYIRSTDAVIFFGSGSSKSYRIFAGPTSWGPGTGFTLGAVSPGNSDFGLAAQGVGTTVYVPQNYVFGSALSGTITYTGTSIAALGLTSGIYTYTSLSSSISVDTITVNIGSLAAVPEPATWAMMLAGFGLVGGALRQSNGRRGQAGRVRVAKVSYAG
jgi:PEP-CTERM motif